MFCPVCKAEYRQGFTRCADCDVDLLASLEVDEVPPETTCDLVYEGSSETEFSAVMAALREAGIPFRESIQVAGFMYASVAMPRFRIWIPRADRERAWSVVSLLFGSPEAGAEPLPASESASDQEPVGQPQWRVEDWNPEEATAGVWSGEDSSMAQFVFGIFSENEIPSRTHVEPSGLHRLFVHPKDEARAREIIRQVQEATPPK